MNAPIPPHDAQREFEQRALRNVRGLVDKIDGLESKASRNQKRMLVGLIVVVFEPGALRLRVPVDGHLVLARQPQRLRKGQLFRRPRHSTNP